MAPPLPLPPPPPAPSPPPSGEAGAAPAGVPVTLALTGMGNVRSVARALERAGAVVTTSGDPACLAASDRVVVPGQGHFGDGARALSGALGDAIREHVRRERPYLGICLGMQLLFDESEEAPGERGLGILPGVVRRFAPGVQLPDGRPRKVPHMGWNLVTPAAGTAGAEAGLVREPEWLYFVHSYHCVPAEPALVAATAEYGETVCAAVARGNLFACQFHPEKSGRAGEAILRAFLAR